MLTFFRPFANMLLTVIMCHALHWTDKNEKDMTAAFVTKPIFEWYFFRDALMYYILHAICTMQAWCMVPYGCLRDMPRDPRPSRTSKTDIIDWDVQLSMPRPDRDVLGTSWDHLQSETFNTETTHRRPGLSFDSFRRSLKTHLFGNWSA